MMHKIVLIAQLIGCVVFSFFAASFFPAARAKDMLIGGIVVIAVGAFVAAMNVREK